MKWKLQAEVEAEEGNEALHKFIDLIPFILVNSRELGWEAEGVRVIEFCSEADS